MRKKLAPFFVILILVSYLSFLTGAKLESKKTQQESSSLKSLLNISNSDKKQKVNPSENLLDPNGVKKQLILTTNISQVLRGALVSFDRNSWTIKYGKETLTVTQQVTDQKIEFFITSRKTNKTTPIKPNELKVGDYVNIITQYLPKEEKMAITSISAYRE